MFRRGGFSLIELMIYLSLSLALSTALFSCFTTFQAFIIQQTLLYEKTIRTLLALDLLHKDIMSASSQLSDWKQHNTFLIKRLNNKGKPEETFITWQIKKGRLQRTEQSRQATSFLGSIFASITIVPQPYKQDKTRVRGVIITYALKTKNKTDQICQSYVRLRNRVLP